MVLHIAMILHLFDLVKSLNSLFHLMLIEIYDIFEEIFPLIMRHMTKHLTYDPINSFRQINKINL